MKKLSLTKERKLAIYARINETGVSRVISFFDVDVDDVRTPHDISSLNFELRVKKNAFSTTNLFVLSDGDGLTVEGADSNDLRIDLSRTNATQKPVENFQQLFSVTEDKTWLDGPWFFHDGEFDGVVENDEILIGSNADIVIEISSGSGSGNLTINDWSGVAALPTTAAKGYIIKFLYDCVVPYLGGDVTYTAGTLAVSLVANSGSPGNWYQL